MTEVWFRNPHNYVRELAEVVVESGEPARIAWDRGMLVKKRIDPIMHAKVYFGSEADVEILAIGPQGTAHLDLEHSLENPKAVYPTWEYGEDFNILEEMVSHPIGMDPMACGADVPSDERPVLGQDHRVVVTNLPNANLGANRAFYRHLRELQEEYPDCNLMLHGLYSYRVMFGFGFGSCDIDPRTSAANGKVILPNGKELAYARTVGQLQWINLLGVSVVDLKIPRNRAIFNIKGALWAGEHYTEDVKFQSSGSVTADPTSPYTKLPTTASHLSNKGMKAQEGDMVSCDTCSLAESCKLYREGAVCSVGGSETSALAAAFNSRNSSKIIDGLGAILDLQARRLERGVQSEEEFGELDPEVTKLSNALFGNGVKLAKLVDPSLTKPLVQINNGRAAQVANASPQEITAEVVRALEAQGIRREDITEELFTGMLRTMMPHEPHMIEGHAEVVNE